MDAEDYSSYPDSQFEEDNVLRELNKCLLAFRQNTTCPIIPKNAPRINRRLNSMPSIDSSMEADSIKDRERNQVLRRYDDYHSHNPCSIERLMKIDIWQDFPVHILFMVKILFRFSDYRQLERVVEIHQKT